MGHKQVRHFLTISCTFTHQSIFLPSSVLCFTGSFLSLSLLLFVYLCVRVCVIRVCVCVTERERACTNELMSVQIHLIKLERTAKSLFRRRKLQTGHEIIQFPIKIRFVWLVGILFLDVKYTEAFRNETRKEQYLKKQKNCR